jgi:hypothetical protein
MTEAFSPRALQSACGLGMAAIGRGIMAMLALYVAPTTPYRRSWYAIPLRLVVGYGFIEHGYAKLARGPDSFAAILHALGTDRFLMRRFAVTERYDIGSPSSHPGPSHTELARIESC